VSDQSFENVTSKWIPEAMHHVPQALMILVGTKIDLRSKRDVIKRLNERKTAPLTPEEGELLAKNSGCFLYHETSALTGEGAEAQEFMKMLIQTTIVFNSVNDISQLKDKKKCMIC
jgi:GTPase SAR1 family protein